MWSMSAVSSAAASWKRFRDERSTPVWTNAVSAVSLLAMPNRSRSYRAPRTRSGLRPEISISSSVLTPSSASAPISASAISRRCLRYAAAILASASRRSASSTVLTRSEDGNTWTTFSSRVRSCDSSSQATAVRTRVSSVAESRSNTFSSSSPRISPAVATTSPAKRFFRSRLRRALRIPWISSRDEARARRHAELALDVVRRIEKNATRRIAVAPGAAGFLQVILQRARYVGVDHQPHVRLVDPHPEGIGGHDRTQLAGDEAPLHLLLRLRRQARVEVVRGDLFHLKVVRDILALPPRRAVDDRAARRVWRQMGRQNLQDVRELLSSRGRDHLEGEIGAFRAAVEHGQLDVEFVPKVPGDVPDDIGFGGRGQAHDRRYRSVTCLLADETSHIAVVGTEVVAPTRQAVRLVQHPGADLTLVQHPPQGARAQLLRRDQQDAGVSQPDPLQGVAPLRHRQQPVDGHAAADAALLQPGHLVRHQRDQGRYHDRQRTGLVVARQRGDLVAERLPRPGGQDAQNMLFPPSPPRRCPAAWACRRASAGSGRKPSYPNQRFRSLPASWRSRHQPQAGSAHAVSLRRRTSRPACGNWWRTQGGITELPPATESHARA